ncbi:hypothetical protein [Streptomyces pinistramenti]|uniref:hypothetical protein n=1 Tax=Streptomyces pinistramenti TaxID=2884812 RepID=UPI001D06728E|nr:hypothetical protein [Streptomyces pinistramenti]MCB5910833.1 hypothetical protein [Streptomyces pinistramenti]
MRQLPRIPAPRPRRTPPSRRTRLAPRTPRAPALAASAAAALCLGTLLTGCGSPADTGYLAPAAAGPEGRAPTKAVPPGDDVELTPLDGADARPSGTPAAPAPPPGHRTNPGSHPSDDIGNPANSATDPATSPGPSEPGAGTVPPGGAADGGTGSPSGSPAPGSPAPGSPDGNSPAPKPPSPTVPAGPGAPAGLVIGKPRLGDTDTRRCQKVTFDVLNTGTEPVTAGTVTFGTHIIGGLGIDWATVTSSRALPLPLKSGQLRTAAYRICVDAWRVPLGMHLDTKDVTFDWK